MQRQLLQSYSHQWSSTGSTTNNIKINTSEPFGLGFKYKEILYTHASRPKTMADNLSITGSVMFRTCLTRHVSSRLHHSQQQKFALAIIPHRLAACKHFRISFISASSLPRSPLHQHPFSLTSYTTDNAAQKRKEARNLLKASYRTSVADA